MPTRIQIRRDTTDRWSSVNPVLAIGELGLDVETGDLRIGDGATPWLQLPAYIVIDASTDLLPTRLMTALSHLFTGVLVYANGAYPPRPAGAVSVKYIGPVQPTSWLPNDEWVNNA